MGEEIAQQLTSSVRTVARIFQGLVGRLRTGQERILAETESARSIELTRVFSNFSKYPLHTYAD